MKKQGCLVTALKILGIIILIPMLIVFGWIAGVIWLLFFRKKLNDTPEKQKKTTIIVSILSALSLIFMIYSFATYKPLKSIEISSDMNGQELEINQDYIIDVTYEPKNASNSDFTYNVDNFSATFDKSGDDSKKAVLHTKSEGNITISVSCGTIDSNSLEFTIVDSSKETEEIADKNADDKKTENEETEKTAESSPEEPPKTINSDIDINFSKNIHNDVTENWRLARVATTKQIVEYALEYCNSYFQSDDEIHAIVNFTLNTTNRLTKVAPDILDVSVYDYVDKEELDAKALFSGTPLAHYEISISTGEITEIPLEVTEPPEEMKSGEADSAAESATDNIDSVAEPVSEAEPENPPETVENTEMVWLSATGDKYHSIPNCGRMNPDKARQVSKADAEARGYEPCTKCH